MVARGNARLFLCVLLMLLPLRLFAQAGQVALIPLWGEDEEAIALFGQELYDAVATMYGYYPVWICMYNLSPDIPEGGFPPSVSPSPSQTGDAPFAITGSVFLNPMGYRHLRLFLWRMADSRPIFSDEMIAPSLEAVNLLLPFMLNGMFSWIPGEIPPSMVAVRPQQIILEGQRTIIYQGAPIQNRWLYIGLRAGGNAQIFDPSREELDPDDIGPYLGNASLAANLNIQFLGFRFANFPFNPMALFLGLQFEGIAMLDFNNEAFSLTFPAMLRITARGGTSSFSLLGGVYALIPLPPLLRDEPGISFDGGLFGPIAGLGWTAGFSMGNRIGPGSFFVDMRFSRDMFTSIMERGYFRRSMVSVSMGYELGFLRR